MKFSFLKTAACAAGSLAVAALVAAGCGGSNDSAGKAAHKSGGLDYVPKTAIGYVTLDTNFEDKAWSKVNDLASSIPQWKTSKDSLLAQINKDSSTKLTYKDDIKPWLGDDAGAAILMPSKSGGSKSATFLWIATTDGDKATTSLKKNGSKKTTSYDGTPVFQNKDTYWAVNGDYVILADSYAAVKLALKTKKDGPNITDDKAAMDAAHKVGDNSVAALVIGSSGLKKAVASSAKSGGSAKALKNINLDNFGGASFGVSAKTHGIAVDGWVGNKGKYPFGKDEKPSLLESLPATTAFAYENSNLGSTLEEVVKLATKSSPSSAGQITQVESLLGLQQGDLAKALDGQFAIYAGPGGSATTPGAALVIKNSSTTADVVNKLVGAGQLVSGKPAVTIKTPNGTGKSLTIGTTTVAVGTLSDVSIVTNTPAWIAGWGQGNTLGDSDTYKTAVKDADVPRKVGAFLYIDPMGAAALGAGAASNPLVSGLAGRLAQSTGAGMNMSSTSTPMAMGATPTPIMAPEPALTSELDSAKASLAYYGPVLVWSQKDASNLALHVFVTIKSPPTPA